MKENIFAERLHDLRHNIKNITQEELASELGISKATVSNYETGFSMPDIEILVKIATYFNVSTDYLLGRTTHLLREDEIPYLHEDKIDFFKQFTSQNPHDESQIVSGYIAKPFLKEELSGYLFAYEMPKDDAFLLSQGDIVYLLEKDAYISEAKVLAWQDNQASFCLASQANSATIMGEIIGVYKFF